MFGPNRKHIWFSSWRRSPNYSSYPSAAGSSATSLIKVRFFTENLLHHLFWPNCLGYFEAWRRQNLFASLPSLGCLFSVHSCQYLSRRCFSETAEAALGFSCFSAKRMALFSGLTFSSDCQHKGPAFTIDHRRSWQFKIKFPALLPRFGRIRGWRLPFPTFFFWS